MKTFIRLAAGCVLAAGAVHAQAQTYTYDLTGSVTGAHNAGTLGLPDLFFVGQVVHGTLTYTRINADFAEMSIAEQIGLFQTTILNTGFRPGPNTSNCPVHSLCPDGSLVSEPNNLLSLMPPNLPFRLTEDVSAFEFTANNVLPAASPPADLPQQLLTSGTVDYSVDISLLKNGECCETGGAYIVQALFSQITLESGPTSVPEPATLSLLGLGLAGVGFMRRRRKN